MKRLIGVLVGALAVLVSGSVIAAQDLLVPAGTLLQCTMDEPNFSSATASVGDHSNMTGCGARPFAAASSARNSV